MGVGGGVGVAVGVGDEVGNKVGARVASRTAEAVAVVKATGDGCGKAVPEVGPMGEGSGFSATGRGDREADGGAAVADETGVG